MSECIFCKIASNEMPCDRIYEDDNYLAFNDIVPQAPFHILIIPKKHISKIADLTGDDNEIMGGLFSVAAKICAKKSISDYRLVVNNGEGVGQSVFHIHLHVLAGRAMKWPPG